MGARRLLARFLRLFGFCSAASTPDLVPVVESVPIAAPVATVDPAPITDTERLSRYLMSRDFFSITKSQVKFRAFLPSPKEDELSITRTEALDESALGAVGAEGADESGRMVHARGDLLASRARASL